MSKKIEQRNILTPEFTLQFADLEEPSKLSGKYRVVAVFDSAEGLADLKAAMKAAAVSKWGDKIPKKLHNPVRTYEDSFVTDEETGEQKNWYPEGSINAAFSTSRPYLVGSDGTRALTPDKFYPGCKCRAVVHPWPYDSKGVNGAGISLTLDLLQFVSDGERLGGGTSAAKALIAANPIKKESAAVEVSEADVFDF